MLAIRLQRTGRTGHAQFRVIVQDDRFSPKSGRVVAYVGSYDPHTKAATLDSDKIGQYLKNGAQPSDRVAALLKTEGVKLPDWVKVSDPQKRAIKHPEKLRRNRPAGAPAPEPKAEEAEPADGEQPTAEVETPAAGAEQPAEPVTEESPAAEETPAEEPAAEPATEEPANEEKPAEESAPEPAAETPEAEAPAEEPTE